MNRSTKAAMLSALVVPGAGHWYLRKKWQAVVLMLIAAAAIVIVVSSAMAQANLIAERVLSGEVQPELGVLMDLLIEQQNTNQSSSMKVATVSLGIAWMVGIVDSWRLGNAEPTPQYSE